MFVTLHKVLHDYHVNKMLSVNLSIVLGYKPGGGGGGGGVLNRCLGREVRPGLLNPDPVKDTIL